MKFGIYLAFVFLMTGSCSSRNETPQPEDYGTGEEENGNASAPTRTAEVEALRNTATFHTVLIKQMKFDPDKLNLHKGDTVLWINKDITDHDVTEETKRRWTSSTLATGKSWMKVISEDADYFCSIHVVMKGKLVVE